MAYVDPAELKYTIEIQIPTNQLDANNHYVRGPDKTIITRAGVRAVKSNDLIEDGAERRHETLQFIIRWRKGISTAAVVKYNGSRYELEYVDPTPFAERFMRLRGVSYDAGVGE